MSWRRLFAGIAASLVGAALWSSVSFALDVPPAPALNNAVVDQTKTLTDQQISALVTEINSSRKEKDYQIAVLMIPTLGIDEFLEGYSLKVAREWGIGTDEKDNGVLILVVKNDRRVRIEVGRGLEGDLTDSESGRIIRNVIAPAFKVNNYYGGLSKAVSSVQAQVEGRADPASSGVTTGDVPKGLMDSLPMLIFFAIFWLAPWMMWIVSILARSKSWWAGGVLGATAGGVVAWIAGGAMLALIGWAVITLFGFILDFFISRNYKEHLAKGGDPAWWAGGTWGGGSSGDSWGGGSSGGGFGGGDFGGGGSSGSW